MKNFIAITGLLVSVGVSAQIELKLGLTIGAGLAILSRAKKKRFFIARGGASLFCKMCVQCVEDSEIVVSGEESDGGLRFNKLFLLFCLQKPKILTKFDANF